MSYLNLPGGIPNFSKAVISLWFRVPRESAIAASGHSLEDGMFRNLLPLITFGRELEAKVYATPTHNVAVIHPYLPGEPHPSTTYNAIYYAETASYRLEPCFVGLRCSSEGTFQLEFNIQTAEYMSIQAAKFITTRMDIYSGADPGAPTVVPGNGVVVLFPNVGVSTIQDVSYVNNAVPEAFLVYCNRVTLEPDVWHHLLLSFDVGGSVAIGTPFASSDCRLWYAIDDKDYRGAENLQPYRDTDGQWGPDAAALDPNAILTSNAWRLSGLDPNFAASQYYQNHHVGLPSGAFAGAAVPSNEAPIGIPSSTAYLDAICRCEMAEFQMWTGITLDTAVEANRRAFLDYKRDERSNPIPDEDGKLRLRPVNPAGAEALLGKRPELLLHKTSKWQKGENTGSLGKKPDSTLIPAGQFAPTGIIDKYKPDPSIVPAS
jgi:hypothetical protein